MPDSVRSIRIVPWRLTEAREARGLNMSQLGDRLGVTRQAISRYELGHANLGPETLTRICRELAIDIDFLRHVPERSVSTSAPVFFRSLQRAARISREVCQVKKLWFSDIVGYLEASVDFPVLNLPDPAELHDKEALDQEEIEEAASLARKVWAIGNEPISDVCLLLENNGILISRAEFGDADIDAFSFWHDGRPIIMLGSDKSSAVRSRFDAAHELGHILLHQAVSAEQLREKPTLKRVEGEANRFAAAFLLPAPSFGRDVRATTLKHFVELKRRWKVSISAMIMRCRDLGILGDDQILSLRKQMALQGYLRREPLDDELPLEGPRLVPRAIEMLLSREVTTAEDLIRRIGVPVEDLEALAGLVPKRLQNPGQVIEVAFGLKRA